MKSETYEVPLSPLGWALTYATRWRLRVLPLVVGRKTPHDRSAPRGLADASCDPEVIRRWWSAAPQANVGIACGASGLLILHVDHRGGPDTAARLAEAIGPLPVAWQAQTPTGTQYYFRDPRDAEDIGSLGPGLHAQNRGYVVAPPSRLASGGKLTKGRRYEWIRPPLVSPWEPPFAWYKRACGFPAASPAADADARDSFLGAAFEAAGWLGALRQGGSRTVRCPWEDAHFYSPTSTLRGTPSESVAVVRPPRSGSAFGSFACDNARCRSRLPLDVLRVLPTAAVDTAAREFPTTFQRVSADLAQAAGAS
jgi:hypothetical protein